jgi:hypothetical protein
LPHRSAALDAPALRLVTGSGWNVIYRIRNTGSMPAYKTTVAATAETVDLPDGPLPTLTGIESDYFGSLAPNGDFVTAKLVQ